MAERGGREAGMTSAVTFGPVGFSLSGSAATLRAIRTLQRNGGVIQKDYAQITVTFNPNLFLCGSESLLLILFLRMHVHTCSFFQNQLEENRKACGERAFFTFLQFQPLAFHIFSDILMTFLHKVLWKIFVVFSDTSNGRSLIQIIH